MEPIRHFEISWPLGRRNILQYITYLTFRGFVKSCNKIILTTFLYRFQKITEEAQNMNRMLGDRLIQIDSNILLDPIKGRKFWETLKINQNISIKFFDREPDMADFIISFYIWQWKKNIFLTLFCNCKFFTLLHFCGVFHPFIAFFTRGLRLNHGRLYRWTENSFPFFLYLKPVEIPNKFFSIIWTSLKVV